MLSLNASHSREAIANSPKDCQNLKFNKKLTTKDYSLKERQAAHLQISITDISRHSKTSLASNPLNSIEMVSQDSNETQEPNSRKGDKSHGKANIYQNLKPQQLSLVKEDSKCPTPVNNQSNFINKTNYAIQKFAPKKM